MAESPPPSPAGSPSELAPAARVVARLEAEGACVEGPSEFSVDLAQGGQKVLAYALARSEDWAPRLVEVAVLLASAAVEFEISASRARVVMEASGFLPAEYARVGTIGGGAVGGDTVGDGTVGGARERALVQLGFALIGLAQSNAAEVEIAATSPEGERVTWVRRPGGADHISVGRSADSRFTLSVQFAQRSRARSRAVHDALTHRCRWSNFDVRVGGRRISTGHESAVSDPVTLARVALDGREVGVCGFCDRRDAQILVFVHGVLAEVLPVDWTPGFVAIVDVDLPRDILQTRVLRGPAFDELMRVVTDAHARSRARYEAAQQRRRRALVRREARVDELTRHRARWRAFGAWTLATLAFVMFLSMLPGWAAMIALGTVGALAAIIRIRGRRDAT